MGSQSRLLNSKGRDRPQKMSFWCSMSTRNQLNTGLKKQSAQNSGWMSLPRKTWYLYLSGLLDRFMRVGRSGFRGLDKRHAGKQRHFHCSILLRKWGITKGGGGKHPDGWRGFSLFRWGWLWALAICRIPKAHNVPYYKIRRLSDGQV